MSLQLIPYNPTKAPLISIQVKLHDSADAFFVSYRLTGDIANLDLGEKPHHARVIKLWEKTCFELFIKNERDEYIEFNFSPVFEWNCFFFKRKGDALAEWQNIERVNMDILHSMDVFQVIAEIKKDIFPAGFLNKSNKGLSAGITSVIKEKNGQISYWALSHHDQRPNFHDFRSFNVTF